MGTSACIRKAPKARRPTRGRGATSVLLVGALGFAALSGCDSGKERPAGQRGATESAAPGTGRFTVAGTGDFLLHEPITKQAAADARARDKKGFDFTPMLAQLKPYIGKADLGVCHVETPLAPPSGPFEGYPMFSSPPQIADAIRGLGYDTCSTASNHSLDQGEPGVRRTIDDLNRVDVRHAGTALSPEQAKQINLMTVKGVKVAQLSYTYGTNGISAPGGKTWLVNTPINPDRVLSDAARAKQAGAEVVILSLHWGTEYQHAATPEQRRLARTLLASNNVDLIIGCHAHVVQPFEQINGKWVVYGMGNQVANPTANEQTTHEGLIAWLTFTRDAQKRWRAQPAFVPTLVTAGPPIRLRTLGKNSGSQATVDRTTKVVRSLGYNVPIASPPK
ncbi:CapA family protein [Actinomadura chibensis]|uniref:CapA family protein n=1 Tax=Actinomadura chibensis TaxID=392828 RepID=A0A5D0NNL6_9ACTN|nr:CapA family protein [Actinomadura chibensis]TYB46133.1 CapA family protein [Actinomadura chibensis]